MTVAKVLLSGEVSSEVEKRFTSNQNLPVTNFQLTYYQPQRQQGGGDPQFHPVVLKVTCWRQLAESVSEKVQKGQHVVVEGRLMTQTVQTPEGIQKKTYEVEATAVHMLPGKVSSLYAGDGKNEAKNTSNSSPAPVAAGVSAGVSQESLDQLTEDDIPF